MAAIKTVTFLCPPVAVTLHSSTRFTEAERRRATFTRSHLRTLQFPHFEFRISKSPFRPKSPCRTPPDQGSKRFSPVHLHRRPSFLGSDETTSPSEPRALCPASPPKPPAGWRKFAAAGSGPTGVAARRAVGCADEPVARLRTGCRKNPGQSLPAAGRLPWGLGSGATFRPTRLTVARSFCAWPPGHEPSGTPGPNHGPTASAAPSEFLPHSFT
jgi:hypothetical protein